MNIHHVTILCILKMVKYDKFYVMYFATIEEFNKYYNGLHGLQLAG